MTATVLLRPAGSLGPPRRRGASRPGLALLGLVLVVATSLVVGLIVASFDGAFTNYVAVRAEVPASGNALAVGSPVEFRDVTIGSVASSGQPLPGHKDLLVLHLDPARVPDLPGGVSAGVAPVSIFGTQYVVLDSPSGTGSGRSFDPKSTIPAGTQAGTASLQNTIANLDEILNAIHPAALDAALTAAATALRGQGSTLGQTLDQASVYLGQMLPDLPALENDIALLGPVATQISGATPDLLQTLANASVTAGTIVSDADQLRSFLTGGTALSAQATSLLNTIQTPLENVLADSGPLLADVSANPKELAEILSGLDTFATSWAAAESHGPFLSFSGSLTVPDSSSFVQGALDAPGIPGAQALVEKGLGPTAMNPPTYTAGDCPRYGSLAGANCPGGPAASARPGPAPVMITGAQVRAAVAVDTGLSGGRPPASPAVATLLLAPLLGGLAASR